jgi:asparagine synthase (glutamine-hydrolysing)
MNVALRHRGPDDEGYLLANTQTGDTQRYSGDETCTEMRSTLDSISIAVGETWANLGIAHRRFSILDLSSNGHQPFVDRDVTCSVVFNGEIFNYLEVQKELISYGHRFSTLSDTEVLLEAYKHWGTDAFQHLNGMWAAVIYDFRRRQLILSRDHIGKMPLYYSVRNQRLYFASEIRSLLAVPSIARTIAPNEGAITAWLNKGLRDAWGETCFEGIHTFPAASYAIASPTFPANAKSYWTVPSQRWKERDLSIAEATGKLRELLSDSVRIRMRADVPWAVELSGGIDSSILAALAYELHGRGTIAYTVRFPQKEWNEEPFARSVANRYEMDYRVLDPPHAGVWDDILSFVLLEEEPNHSPNLHTNQSIRRQMRADGIKMLLNGAAGDELFAGYDYFYGYALVENLANLQIIQFWKNVFKYSSNERITANLMLCARRVASSVFRRQGRLSEFHSMIDAKDRFAINHAGFRVFRKSLSDRILIDLVSHKVPYWMRSGDKTHMGIPVEGRVPFLDYRVVEFALSLPTSYLIRDGWHKWILRKAFEDTLPTDVLWRKRKMGFPFPYEEFWKTSKTIVESILHLSSEESRSRMTQMDWPHLSYVLWAEVFLKQNRKLIQFLHDLEYSRPMESVGLVPEFYKAQRSLRMPMAV